MHIVEAKRKREKKNEKKPETKRTRITCSDFNTFSHHKIYQNPKRAAMHSYVRLFDSHCIASIAHTSTVVFIRWFVVEYKLCVMCDSIACKIIVCYLWHNLCECSAIMLILFVRINSHKFKRLWRNNNNTYKMKVVKMAKNHVGAHRIPHSNRKSLVHFPQLLSRINIYARHTYCGVRALAIDNGWTVEELKNRSSSPSQKL